MFQISFISSNIDENFARAFGARIKKIYIATFYQQLYFTILKLPNWLKIPDSIAQLNQTLSSSSND